MYTLDCTYYMKEFNTLQELVDDVISSGMDPNYNIVKDGIDTQEQIIDFIVY